MPPKPREEWTPSGVGDGRSSLEGDGANVLNNRVFAGYRQPIERLRGGLSVRVAVRSQYVMPCWMVDRGAEASPKQMV
jgi:hypothetical protein